MAPSGWQAVAQTGASWTSWSEWIPLPQGSTLMHLPGRLAVGWRAGEPEPRPISGALAVAAVLPVGYLRLMLPALHLPGREQPTLPLYGYCAAAEREGEVVVAALRSDDYGPWTGARAPRPELERAVIAAQRLLPRNRVVAQLSICALQHGCLTAQNTFLRRGEGALPTSAACNADCLGCISLQTDSGAPAPQPRMPKGPTAQELVEVAGYHLEAPSGSMVSFGQGCEGEPLLRERALRSVVAELKDRFPGATIHINTNGSRPQALRRLIEAGLNSCRISVFSFREELLRAYYRPRGYGLAEVLACARVARELGCQLTINLLTFPGVTDLPDEAALTIRRLGELDVQQLQLRSLNVDPSWLLSRLPASTARPLGLRKFVERVRVELPGLKLGNFTRPVAAALEATSGS